METKAEFINHLIDRIHTSTYTGVEQVLTFVDWLDQQLSTLVKIRVFILFWSTLALLPINVLNSLFFCQTDESAVLKHFNWPERKADALREAASEYRHINCLLTEISSSLRRDEDDGGSSSTLRKISSLLDKYVSNTSFYMYTSIYKINPRYYSDWRRAWADWWIYGDRRCRPTKSWGFQRTGCLIQGWPQRSIASSTYIPIYLYNRQDMLSTYVVGFLCRWDWHRWVLRNCIPRQSSRNWMQVGRRGTRLLWLLRACASPTESTRSVCIACCSKSKPKPQPDGWYVCSLLGDLTAKQCMPLKS